MSAQFTAHPGPAAYPRLLAVPAQRAESYVVTLRAGRELFEELKTVAYRVSAGALLVRMAALELREAALHVVVDGRDGKMVDYGAPITLADGCSLVSAQMVIGWDGERAVTHCHGYVRCPEGHLLGGHLAPGMCQLASDAQVHVTALHGCAFRPSFDEETGFKLLSPTHSAGELRHAKH